MNNDINDLSKKFNHLQIVPYIKRNNVKTNNVKSYDVNSLMISMNKMRIGKKKHVKNNVINNINTKYELFSLLNKKLFMDEIFGKVLLKYFQRPLITIKEESTEYYADDENDEHDENNISIIEID